MRRERFDDSNDSDDDTSELNENTPDPVVSVAVPETWYQANPIRPRPITTDTVITHDSDAEDEEPDSDAQTQLIMSDD
jgi:hypothetical protein